MTRRGARSRSRPLAAALFASTLLHLALAGVITPPFAGHDPDGIAEPPSIAVRLLPPSPETSRASPPVTRAPSPVPVVMTATSDPRALRDRAGEPPGAPPPDRPAPEPTVESPPPPPVQATPAPPRDTDPPATLPGITREALATLPARGRLGYAISTGSPAMPVGRATYAWETGGGRYRLELVARTSGLVGLLRPAEARQWSEGELDERGLRPERFLLDRGDGRAPEEAVFDRVRQRITYGPAGSRKEAPLAPGTQDALSLMLHLAFAPPGEGRRELWLATGRSLHLQAYATAGVIALETPAGGFRALQLRRQVSAEGDEGYDLWLAEDRPWLPVRIRWTDRRGRVTEAVLDTLELPGR